MRKRIKRIFKSTTKTAIAGAVVVGAYADAPWGTMPGKFKLIAAGLFIAFLAALWANFYFYSLD